MTKLKLTLNLDDLEVTSFETVEDGEGERGTVFGRSAQLDPSIEPCGGGSMASENDCPSNWETCDYCYNSGPWSRCY